MRISAMIVAVAFAAVLAAPASAGMASSNGVVTMVEGKVSLQKAGKGDWLAVKANDSLSPGDVVRTDTASRAELRLADGSVVRLSANSKLALEQLQADAATGARRMTLNGMLGRFWSHVVKMKGDSTFAMKAGGSIIGVRGTAYDTTVSETGEVQVKVHDGAAVVTKSDGVELAQVGKNEGARMSGGAVKEKSGFDPKLEEGDEWVRWNHERDKVRIMVIIDERDVEGVNAPMPVSESEVVNALLTKYEFRVVDQAQVNKIREQDKARAAARGDAKAAASLGEAMYADLVITGFAKAEKQTGLEILDKSGIKSVKTVLTARTIRVDTGDIISSNTFTGRGADVTDSAAAAKALVDAGRSLSEFSVEQLIGAWSTMKTKGAFVQLMIENATFSQWRAIQDKLKGMVGANGVTAHEFANGVGMLSVSSTEGAEKLAEKLDGSSAGGATWQVVEVSGNRLKLRVK